MRFLHRLLVVGLLILSPAFAAPQAIPDFTFLHVTDVHAPSSVSEKVIGEIGKLGEVEMTPYKLTAKPPSFIVVSGDLTDLGDRKGAWNTYLSYWKDVRIPVYHELGNHDGLWFANRNHMRALYGGAYYWSFDKFGCHFIGLDPTIPQDVRAAITREQLAWLEQDLKSVKPETPVFLVVHHPLNDPYFGSPYAVDQFIDMLRPYNLVAILYGHGHSAVHKVQEGIDTLQGGTTVTPEPVGFNIVSIQDGILRVAYKKFGETAATKGLLEKPIPPRSSYPKIEILSPREKGTYKLGVLKIRVRVSGNAKPITQATFTMDSLQFDTNKASQTPMEFKDGEYQAKVPFHKLTPGGHYLRVTLADEAGNKFPKSVSFYTEAPKSRLAWRSFVGGSIKGAPAVTKDTVYVGSTDSNLYALNRSNGRVKWSFTTGAEVMCRPLVVGDTVYFGSGDGKLYAVSTNGKLKWTFPTKEAVYSSPIYTDGMILFGSNDSNFYAVDAQTGRQRWVFEDAECTIPSKAFVDGGAVYFAAWDAYMYAVDIKTGKLKWKSLTQGSISKNNTVGANGPGEISPVAAGGKVFVGDHTKYLTAVDTSTGSIAFTKEICTGIGLSEDKKAIYVRGSIPDKFTKYDLDGGVIWAVDAAMDTVPAAPVEKDGVVYMTNRLGLVQAFDASDGHLLWKYSATPTLYVLSDVAVSDGMAYITGMDGSVSALRVANN